MARDVRPVFLERKSYRRRRMTDALRLVVILGVVLWLIPVTWPNGTQADVQSLKMSRALLYVFGVWAALILLSGSLARLLRDRTGGAERQTGETENKG